jgi:hypothetical protein
VRHANPPSSKIHAPITGTSASKIHVGCAPAVIVKEVVAFFDAYTTFCFDVSL